MTIAAAPELFAELRELLAGWTAVSRGSVSAGVDRVIGRNAYDSPS